MDNVSFMRKAKAQLAGQWTNAVLGTLVYVLVNAVLCSTYVLELVFGGPVMFGYVLFMACLCDTRSSRFELLFKGFERFVETLLAGLILTVAVSIGTALLIVPGIIMATGFGMTFFIMADDANIGGVDALKQSWNMMDGHKMDLFCLWLRFIGWGLLCVLTCGIGFIWLIPYMTASTLNFYRSLRYGTY